MIFRTDSPLLVSYAQTMTMALSRWVRGRGRQRAAIYAGAITLVGMGLFISILHSSLSTQTLAVNLLASGWTYAPGAQLENDGVHVSYLGRSIVRQDGTPGQDNPPVNLYGLHLAGDGDLTVTAAATALHGTAVLRLYGTPPVISDEFRQEPDSLELALTPTTLKVARWHAYAGGSAYAQAAAETHTVTFTRTDRPVVRVQRQAGKFTVSINGAAVYSTAVDGQLAHALWFGVSAAHPGDAWTLGRLDANISHSVAVIDTEHIALPARQGDGLQTLATHARPGFTVGAAVALGPLVADDTYRKLALSGNFGQITTENVLKWQFIHPQPQTYDFREADALVAIARQAGLAVQGHTLVFGEANPSWVQQLSYTTDADKAHVRQVMVDHITQTVGHFKGKVASWDVVNEPLADYDAAAGADGLRQHVWYKALGSEYIATAFRAARAADPHARLFMNEFGLEADGPRWNTFLQLVTQLKAQGVPIDGVGFEAHVYDSGDVIDPSILRAHIRQLAAIGVDSRVSEMDVYSDDGTDVQARQYAAVFAACFAEPTCVSWSTWGITDRYDLSLDDKNRIRPGADFLWDANGQPTPAVAAIRRVIH